MRPRRSKTHSSHSQGNIIFHDIFRMKVSFPGQSIQDLKVINQDIREKAYHIQYMIDY